ncbi:MAG: GTPase HflX [Bacteroidales bacterium]|nr:GTPase HflX [Bacteroidales bacterium]
MKEEEAKQERAVLIGISFQGQDEAVMQEYLDELEFLAYTAGAVVAARFSQNLVSANPRTFVGTGKAEEIALYIKENEIDIAVFDDELTPSQLRNIEKIFGCRVLDRTNLILDIFAARARTSHARTQVELAQYQYLLPRLTRMWTHLERQRGGIGLRGPGETEIETDRRIIRDKISKLKEQLKKIDRQMATQRKNRAKLIRVALVGYTNVGKSTIMNLLSKSDIFAENKLFATLDTTVRKVVVGNLAFLLSDTVGFIRKLPHSLVESFKSTLDEVREADILLHIVDISHPGFEEQIEVVNETLKELDSLGKNIILVFNKIDAYDFIEKDADDLLPATKRNFSLDELRKTWMGSDTVNKTIFISAKKKTNIEEFRKLLYEEVRKQHVKRYPYNDFLYEV